MTSRAPRGAIWVLVVLLAILHYDFWLWDDRSLWFGFLPVGLGYQALISLAASGLWLLAVNFAWPAALERWASEPTEHLAALSDSEEER